MLYETVAEQSRAMAEMQRMLRHVATGMQINLDGDDEQAFPLPEGKDFHFFISHCQATGGDQANLLCTNLETLGVKVWYDMKMPDLTEAAMVEGVKASVAMIVLLTPRVMSRPFCHLEMRTARDNGVRMVGIKEDDDRRGKVDFGTESETCPSDLLFILNNVEFLPFRRRYFEAQTMYSEILKRGGIAR